MIYFNFGVVIFLLFSVGIVQGSPVSRVEGDIKAEDPSGKNGQCKTTKIGCEGTRKIPTTLKKEGPAEDKCGGNGKTDNMKKSNTILPKVEESSKTAVKEKGQRDAKKNEVGKTVSGAAMTSKNDQNVKKESDKGKTNTVQTKKGDKPKSEHKETGDAKVENEKNREIVVVKEKQGKEGGDEKCEKNGKKIKDKTKIDLVDIKDKKVEGNKSVEDKMDKERGKGKSDKTKKKEEKHVGATNCAKGDEEGKKDRLAIKDECDKKGKDGKTCDVVKKFDETKGRDNKHEKVVSCKKKEVGRKDSSKDTKSDEKKNGDKKIDVIIEGGDKTNTHTSNKFKGKKDKSNVVIEGVKEKSEDKVSVKKISEGGKEKTKISIEAKGIEKYDSANKKNKCIGKEKQEKKNEKGRVLDQGKTCACNLDNGEKTNIHTSHKCEENNHKSNVVLEGGTGKSKEKVLDKKKSGQDIKSIEKEANQGKTCGCTNLVKAGKTNIHTSHKCEGENDKSNVVIEGGKEKSKAKVSDTKSSGGEMKTDEDKTNTHTSHKCEENNHKSNVVLEGGKGKSKENVLDKKKNVQDIKSIEKEPAQGKTCRCNNLLKGERTNIHTNHKCEGENDKSKVVPVGEKVPATKSSGQDNKCERNQGKTCKGKNEGGKENNQKKVPERKMNGEGKTCECKLDEEDKKAKTKESNSSGERTKKSEKAKGKDRTGVGCEKYDSTNKKNKCIEKEKQGGLMEKDKKNEKGQVSDQGKTRGCNLDEGEKTNIHTSRKCDGKNDKSNEGGTTKTNGEDVDMDDDEPRKLSNYCSMTDEDEDQDDEETDRFPNIFHLISKRLRENDRGRIFKLTKFAFPS